MSLDDVKRTDADTSPESNEDRFSAFEEVNRVEKQKPSRKKLPKRTRTLILTSGVAVLLAAALLVLTLLPHPGAGGSEGSSSTPVVDTAITLLDKTVKDAVAISRVDIENGEESFSLQYNTTEKKLFLKGYEDITLNEGLTETLIAYTTLISAADKVSTPGNLKDYGLDIPQAKATITYTDGSTATLTVGNTTPSEDGYYTQISGDNNVYIFESDCVYLFTVRAASFADTTLLTTPTVKKDDANGTAVLKEVSYSGKNHPTPLKLRRSYHTDSEEMTLFSYIITKPYTRGITDTVIGQLSNFKSLTASQALYLHPTAQQKQKFGFDDPLTVMDITMAVETSEDTDTTESNITNTVVAEKKIYYNSYSTTITVGSMDSSSNYVVMVDGIDAIFLVDNSALSAIAERTYTNTVNQLLFLKNISQLGRISVTTDGKQHDFYLTHFPEKENNDESMVVTESGKIYPTEDFRELYQMLMGLERYGTPSDTYEKTATLKIDIYTTNGTHYLGATYYPISGTLCAVETTEGEVFTTRWRNVTHFIEQIENYLNGKKVLILT